MYIFNVHSHLLSGRVEEKEDKKKKKVEEEEERKNMSIQSIVHVSIMIVLAQTFRRQYKIINQSVLVSRFLIVDGHATCYTTNPEHGLYFWPIQLSIQNESRLSPNWAKQYH